MFPAHVLRVPLLTPGESARVGGALLRSGLIRLYRPDRLLGIGLDLARHGPGPALGPRPGARLYPDAPAFIDDSGTVTFRELDERCTAMASALADAGLGAGQSTGLLARNSAGFYQAMVGAARLGADVVYLNAGFTPDQVAAVAVEQGLNAVMCDEELADRVPEAVLSIPLGQALASPGGAAAPGPARSPRPSRHVILTSGTSGKPKGTARTGGGLDSLVSVLAGLPYRVRERHLIAAPMFHAWGLLNALLAGLYSSTAVVTRNFDAEATLALVERERCDVLVAVPVMLRRIMDLPAQLRAGYDTSSLRVVTVSGSPLSEALAGSFMDAFGDILYNLYGSTEASLGTVASPRDLRTAPGTAGRPLTGVRVRVVDGAGRDCPPGELGAIQVGSGDSVSAVGSGPVRTGDLGWFDRTGLLFVAAREDEMVVSGGENVYPVTVEEILEQHPAVREAAVVAEADREFGQVLVAHVGVRDGSPVTPDALRAWCKRRLAPFQVPRRVVIHAALPRTETGKILKRELAGDR